MTMNSSGPISLGGTTAGVSIEIENGGNGTTQISLNDAAVRSLAGKPSGAITMPTDFYGKSNSATISYTFTSNTADASLNVTSISGYVAGKSTITITVNSGVYLYATSTGNAGLTLTGGASGDTITLVNNGYIMGQGGNGGNATSLGTSPTSGGPALSIGFATTVSTASGYIGGGGGGGGSYYNSPIATGGGGGAGGGIGGNSNATGYPTTGGAGGGIGSVGVNGTVSQNGYGSYVWTAAGGGGSGGGGGSSKVIAKGPAGSVSGGGGGRIFPGTGGAGSVSYPPAPSNGGAGGSANAVGGSASGSSVNGSGAGGGGGWGAAGGVAIAPSAVTAPGSGGNAINKNGFTLTFSGSSANVYGAVV